MLISPAYAQDLGGSGGPDFVFILMMVAMFAVFWFLVIRPQQRRAKDHKAMQQAIKRGDHVVTSGGIIGRVARLEGDDTVTLEIADGVRVKCRQSMIANLLSKSEPREEKPEKPKKDG